MDISIPIQSLNNRQSIFFPEMSGNLPNQENFNPETLQNSGRAFIESCSGKGLARLDYKAVQNRLQNSLIRPISTIINILHDQSDEGSWQSQVDSIKFKPLNELANEVINYKRSTALKRDLTENEQSTIQIMERQANELKTIQESILRAAKNSNSEKVKSIVELIDSENPDPNEFNQLISTMIEEGENSVQIEAMQKKISDLCGTILKSVNEEEDISDVLSFEKSEQLILKSFETLNNEHKKLVDEISQMAEENNKLKKLLDESNDNQKLLIESLQSQIAQLESSLKEERLEHRKLEEKIEEACQLMRSNGNLPHDDQLNSIERSEELIRNLKGMVNRLDEMNDKANTASSEKVELEKQMDEMKGQIDKDQNQIQKLKQHIEHLSAGSCTVDENGEIVNVTAATVAVNFDEIEEEEEDTDDVPIQERGVDFAKLARNPQEMKEVVTTQMNEIKSQQQEITRLEETAAEREKKIEELENKVKQQQSILLENMSEESLKKHELLKLLDSVDDETPEEELTPEQRQVRLLNRANDELTKKQNEIEELEKDTNEKNVKIEELTQESNENKTKIEELEKKHNEAQQKADDLEQTLTFKDEEMSQLKTQMEELQKDLNDKTVLAQSTNDEKEQQIEELQKVTNEKEAIVENQKQQIEELEKVTTLKDEEITIKQKEIDEKEEKVQQLTTELNEKSDEINELKENNAKSMTEKEEQIKQAELRINELLNELKEQKENSGKLEEEVKKSNEVLEKVHSEQKEQKEVQLQEEQEIEKMKERIKLLESPEAIQTLLKENEKLEDENRKLSMQNEANQKILDEIEEGGDPAQAQIIKKLRNNLDEMIQNMSNTSKENEQLKKQMNEIESRYNIENETEEEQKERIKNNLNQVLGAFENHLQQAPTTSTEPDNLGLKEKLGHLEPKVQYNIVLTQTELQNIEEKSKLLRPKITNIEAKLQSGTLSPNDKNAYEFKLNQFKKQQEQLDNQQVRLIKQKQSFEKAQEAIVKSEKEDDIDDNTQKQKELLAALIETINPEHETIFNRIKNIKNDENTPLHTKLSRTMDNIYDMLYEINPTNAPKHQVPFEVKDDETLEFTQLMYAMLLSQLLKNASGSRQNKSMADDAADVSFRPDINVDNMTKEELVIHYHKLAEHDRKLTIVCNKFKKQQQRDEKIKKYLFSICPPLSKSVSPTSKLAEVVRAFVSLFPALIADTVQKRVEMVLNIIISAQNEFFLVFKQLVQHITELIQMNRDRIEGGRLVGNNDSITNYAKVLKVLFPTAMNITITSNWNDIKHPIKKMFSSIRADLQLIPNSKIPPTETLYTYVGALRRSLGPNTSLGESSGLTGSSKNVEHDHIKDEQIEKWQNTLQHCIPFTNLAQALCDIIDVEYHGDPSQITLQTIYDLLNATNEKMQEREKIAQEAERNLKGYKKKVGKLLVSLDKTEPPPKMQPLIQSLQSSKK